MIRSLIRSHLRRSFACLASIAALAGCGGDGSDAVGADGLSGADVKDMVLGLRALGSFAADLSLATPQSLSAGLAAQMRLVNVERDLPCAGGGKAHFSGAFETYFSGYQAAYIADLTQEHMACKTTERNSRTWTFDGAPNITLHTEYVLNTFQHTLRMYGWFKGSFAWTSSDGASGTCTADIKLSEKSDPGNSQGPSIGQTGQITGTICARAVDFHY